MKLYIWILYLLLAIIIVFGLELLFRKKNRKFKIIFIPIKFILSILFAFLVMAGPIFLRPVQPLLTTLYIVLFMDTFSSIINLFVKKYYIQKLISLLLIISFFAFGTINMYNVVKKEYVIESEKVTNEVRFAFISDVHVGSSQSIEKTLSILDEINNENIDFIVLGGDITDNYTSKEDMIKFYEYLNNMSCPVYMVYGNHDLQTSSIYKAKDTYTKEELEEAINNSKVEIIDNQTIFINGIRLTGIQDKTLRESDLVDLGITEEGKTYDNYFNIYIDHQPEKIYGDLILSGHTHAGQYFPLGILYNILGPVYGEYDLNYGSLIVSSGISGWRVPFRSDHHSEWLLITIK